MLFFQSASVEGSVRCWAEGQRGRIEGGCVWRRKMGSVRGRDVRAVCPREDVFEAPGANLRFSVFAG